MNKDETILRLKLIRQQIGKLDPLPRQAYSDISNLIRMLQQHKIPFNE